MLIVPIEEAEPGMKLALNVTHPEQPDHDLLRAGYLLDAAVIRRMQEMGVDVVYVDYPGLGDLDRQMANLQPARQQIYRQIKSTLAAVQETAQPVVAFADYYLSMRDLVLTLMQQGEHPVYLDLLSARLGSDAVAHATAVAQLSVTLGIRLQRYLIDQRRRLPPEHASEVVNLGVAGMLHDLGKAKIPAHLRKHTDLGPPEDQVQRTEWEAHSRIGYEMIRPGVEASAAATVLHHHQHFDGSGFPAVRNGQESAPQSGTQIHVFARILLVADLFDRLASDASSRTRRPNLEVLHFMRVLCAGRTDPRVLDMLAEVVPPFPPGTRVRLSDGSEAIAARPNPKHPYQPYVRRTGADGQPSAGELIDLSIDGAPSIETAGNLRVAEYLPVPA